MASKPEQLEQAIDLYRGDLLDGFSLDGEQFEDWLRVERERLRNLAVAALEKLIKRYAASEDHARCVQAATRLLALEPLREDIHRVLMMSYASQGRFTLALKQYELCRDALQRELDVQPEPVTQSLYENLRVRRVKAGKSSIDTQDPTSSRTARLLEMQSAMRRQLELAPAFSDVPVLPDRPSVAIMPFDCELDNADQKYFAGGLTEDITTGLTKFHELFVIDTRSSQAVRELTVDMREIGRARSGVWGPTTWGSRAERSISRISSPAAEVELPPFGSAYPSGSKPRRSVKRHASCVVSGRGSAS